MASDIFYWTAAAFVLGLVCVICFLIDGKNVVKMRRKMRKDGIESKHVTQEGTVEKQEEKQNTEQIEEQSVESESGQKTNENVHRQQPCGHNVVNRMESNLCSQCGQLSVKCPHCRQHQTISNCQCDRCDLVQKSVRFADCKQPPLFQSRVEVEPMVKPRICEDFQDILKGFKNISNDLCAPQSIVEKFANAQSLKCQNLQRMISEDRECNRCDNRDKKIELLTQRLQTSLKTVGELTHTLNKSVDFQEQCKSELDQMKQELQKGTESTCESVQPVPLALDFQTMTNSVLVGNRMSEMDTVSLQREVQRRKSLRNFRNSQDKQRSRRMSTRKMSTRTTSIQSREHPQRQIPHGITDDSNSIPHEVQSDVAYIIKGDSPCDYGRVISAIQEQDPEVPVTVVDLGPSCRNVGSDECLQHALDVLSEYETTTCQSAELTDVPELQEVTKMNLMGEIDTTSLEKEIQRRKSYRAGGQNKRQSRKRYKLAVVRE